MGNKMRGVRAAGIVICAALGFIALIAVGVHSIDVLGEGRNPPSAVDFINSVVAILALVATTFVGIAAWRTSRKAAEIAADALSAERKRDDASYEAALNAAIIRVFEALGEYARELNDWLQTSGRLEESAPMSVNPDELPYPNEPTNVNVVFRLDAAGLVARADDRNAIHWMTVYVAEIDNRKLFRRSVRMKALSRRVRAWRDGTQSRDALIAFLRQKVNEMRLEK
ncbi:hypothetical protein [Herbiconiux sp.]|uniref:hypothetical protein n=1 Tax=Herbiconiux sp. TaxID=1871186 RepID=UPI0025C1A86C|nr:hypothetical protein [Herbiconiux sp.]